MIHDYLLEEKLLREEISNKNLDFSFRFVYPEERGPNRGMIVQLIKNKNYIIVFSPTKISEAQSNKFKNLEEGVKRKFLTRLVKLAHLKEVLHSFNFSNRRYAFIKKIYFKKGVPKNIFFSTVEKLYHTTILSHYLLQEYFSNGINDDSLSSDDGLDSNLYS